MLYDLLKKLTQELLTGGDSFNTAQVYLKSMTFSQLNYGELS